jgi:hypothetical protein
MTTEEMGARALGAGIFGAVVGLAAWGWAGACAGFTVGAGCGALYFEADDDDNDGPEFPHA